MQIIKEGFSCVVTPSTAQAQQDELDQAVLAGYNQVYVIHPGGILVHHRLRPGKDGRSRYVQMPVEKIPGFELKEYKPELCFLPDGKIPMRLLDEVKAFFREVISKKGRALEAMIWVLWNQERGYFLHVPNQIVSHASAQYDWTGLPENSSIIVDIHSHADFGAFFSGTDDRDDAMTIRFSGVFGHNHTPNPSSKFRFNYLGRKIEVEISDLFAERPADPVEVPQEWLDKVQIVAPSPSKWTGPKTPMSWGGSYPYGMAGPRNHRYNGAEYPTHGYPTAEQQDDKNRPPVTSEVDAAKSMTPEDYSKKRLSNKERRRLEREAQKKQEESVQASLIGDEEEVQAMTEAGPFEEARRLIEQSAFHFGVVDEDALSAQADNYLDNLRKRVEAGEPLPGEEETSAGGFEVVISKDDIPMDFDVVACNHGVEAAKAYAMIDFAATSLIGKDQVLGESVTELFNLVDDEQKLAVFRKLYDTLPKSAIQSIATNGMN